ncbi:MAG TPA: hypothetical protein VMS77_02250 [Conexivisphaerales archaeon]|nr:hypothetical protein [Conexivisphaerales archaeon]
MESSEEPVEKKPEWVEEVTKNLDYYLKTEEGKQRLLDLAKKENERILEEVAKVHRPQRDIIWLSRFCRSCRYLVSKGERFRCARWDVKIVKPFYGRPLWFIALNEMGRPVMSVSDLDWNHKWIEVSDAIIEKAVEHINGGKPYECYDPQ